MRAIPGPFKISPFNMAVPFIFIGQLNGLFPEL